MSDKIDFFDDRNVGPEARRLAFCFNVAARMVSQGANPFQHAEQLFRRTTGLERVPEFNPDEQRFLKLQMLEMAAIRDQGQTVDVEDLGDAANVLWLAAREMNLIPEDPETAAPPRVKEQHISFPGA